MLIKTTLSLLLFIIADFLGAQSLNYKWAKHFEGTTTLVSVNGSVVDALGNIYTSGCFNDTLDFDTGPGVYLMNSIGDSDAFICKMDPLGNLIWAKQMGGNSTNTNCFNLSLDNFGNLYLVGNFYGSCDFDPGTPNFLLSSSGLNDIFILKLDTSGNFKWAKKQSGTLDEFGYGIAVDLQGNIYTTGEYKGTVDFDPGVATYNLISSSNTSDIYISKLDSTGRFIWAKSIGNNSTDVGNSIAVDNIGSVFVTGFFGGPMDFDPSANVYTLVSAGNRDTYVLRMDSSGNFLWAKRWGGVNGDQGTSIKIDAKKNIYTTGVFRGIVDFDPGTGTHSLSALSSALEACFISKLDSLGNFIFARGFIPIFSGAGFVAGNCIDIDSIGNIYTTGYTNGFVDFDPGTGSYVIQASGQIDIFISKLDKVGNFILAKILGSTGADRGRKLVVGTSGEVYTSGVFMGRVDFDPGAGIDTLSNASSSIFIQKMLPCNPSFSSITNSYCDSVIINGIKYTVTGVYTQVLGNKINCDSVITLNLTIKKRSINLLSLSACDSLIINGQTFFSTGIYTQWLTNAVGCDSVLTLNIAIKKATSSTIFATACNSYTLNSQTYTTTGIYKQTRLNSVGCDSIITLNLTLKDSYKTLIASSCNSYILNTQTYVTSGTYTQKLLNAVGCDSIITLILTIHTPTSSTLTITHCGNYTLNSQTYVASGVYLQTITNSVGCDSIITLNLTIKNGSVNSITAASCTSYILNGITYSTSGNYTQTKTNSVGCDSIITLNLTIKNITSNTITTSACKNFILNGSVYSTSGIYTQTKTNFAGCDSIITLNLTIITDTTVTKNGNNLTANATGAVYQWLDCNKNMAPILGKTSRSFITSVNGSFAVIISKNSCIDTSSCFNITGLGLTSPSKYDGIKVFPNPTNDKVLVSEYSLEDKNDFLFYNSLGQIILIGKLTGNQTEIDISTFAIGIYFLQIHNQATVETIKIIKK